VRHILITILSILLLYSPLFGQSTPKYESVGQCVLQMMTEKKLTGNEMFELVKKECQRILGKVGVKGKKRQKGVLYGRSVNGKWGWYGLGDEEKDSKYVGKTKNGKPNGQGTQTWSDFGDKYVGEWKNGKKHGQGTFTWSVGSKYVGEWKDGEENGQGTYTWSDFGEKFEGGWKDGKKHGQGTYTYSDGDKYVGEWKDGKRNGQGTYTWSSGNKYVGEFKDGKKHGQGKMILPDGKKYVGEYKDGPMWN